jgi:hypothetical protein
MQVCYLEVYDIKIKKIEWYFKILKVSAWQATKFIITEL